MAVDTKITCIGDTVGLEIIVYTLAQCAGELSISVIKTYLCHEKIK